MLLFFHNVPVVLGEMCRMPNFTIQSNPNICYWAIQNSQQMVKFLLIYAQNIWHPSRKYHTWLMFWLAVPLFYDCE